MKIVQTPVRFYPAVGGVEKYVLDLSSQLVKRGHRVTVICANEPESEINEVKGIRVERLAYIGKIANSNITLPLFFYLISNNFDLIHTHMPTPWSAELSLIVARIKRKPCILTYHNDVEKTGLLGVLTKIYNATLLPLLLAGVDKILVTQPRYLIDSQVLLRFHSKISVIPNGLSCLPSTQSSHNLQREEASLLFVSVLDKYHRYKGLEYLIRALTYLKQDWPQIRLEVVGKGELINEYQALAERLHLNENIHFNGYVNDQDLDLLYRKATVFVLPSIDTHEGFGIVLLEAMAYEIPVVTTQAVGLSDEIAACKSGLIVPEKDSSALAEGIHQILSNPLQAREMGKNGRQLVSHKYLWSDICEAVIQIYKDVTL